MALSKHKKMKMSLNELEGGESLGNCQKVVGRVFPGAQKATEKGQTVASKYVVTGPHFSDILYVEAWGPQAARLCKVCVDGNVVEISGSLPIKELNQKKKAWTASSADIFMSFTTKGVVDTLSKDLEYPNELPRQNMQELKDADGGLVHVEGVISDIEGVREVKLKQQPGQTEEEAEESLQTATLQGDGVKISIECWGESAGKLSMFASGATVRFEYVRFKVKNDGQKTLVGTDIMEMKLLEGQYAEEVLSKSGGTAPSEDLTRFTGGGNRRNEIWNAPAKLISLNMLGATLEENEPRTFLNTVYEVYGFAVEQMSPLTLEASEWSYLGCPECNKKVGSCQHTEEPVPRFSMQLKLTDATASLLVKAFSDGVEGILECCESGQALWKNKDADTDVNQQAIVKHLQQGVGFCGRFQFRLEPAYKERAAKNAVELCFSNALPVDWTYPPELTQIFREGGEDHGVPYVNLESVVTCGRNVKVKDADGVMRKVRKIKTAVTLDNTHPSLQHDDEEAGLRATWGATMATSPEAAPPSGSALGHVHKLVLAFTMDMPGMTGFLQTLHGGDTIEACLRLLSIDSSEQATWRVVSYTKIAEPKQLKALMMRMEQTEEMRAKANKTPETLKGTPSKRQRRVDELSDFSTPRLGCYDESSPDKK